MVLRLLSLDQGDTCIRISVGCWTAWDGDSGGEGYEIAAALSTG
jgi:hypothetical protein